MPVASIVKGSRFLLCHIKNKKQPTNMKKRIISVLSALCVGALSSFGIVTLDLSEALGSYPQSDAGCWTETYTDGTNVRQGIFVFSHSGSADAGMGMAYWDGFTLCTNSETEDYGQGGSDGWIYHQWGCMAGGGLNAEGEPEYGNPYLVAYWGYHKETIDESYHSLQVDFADNQAHKAVGVYVCNHPWPYYGNIHGDGFAKGFENEGDRFAVVVHGLNEYGEPTGTQVVHELAAFRDGELQQSDQWEYIDLTPLGSVYGIYFTMETTDASSQFGANTAVYFCMDRLSVEEAGGTTGWHECAADDSEQAVYTVSGTYIGSETPNRAGVYIIRRGNETRKTIIR